jgi:hypothetical protein
MREWLALNGETEEKVPTHEGVPIKSPTPLAFTVIFHGFMTQPVAGTRCAVRTSCCLRGVPSPARPLLLETWSDPKANLEVLLRQLDREIAELQERLATLAGRERRRRPAYAAQALMIDPPQKGGPWQRYSRDADTALYRALKQYWAEKAREAARQAEAVDQDEEAGVADASPPPEAESDPPLVPDCAGEGANEDSGVPGAASVIHRNEPGAQASETFIPGGSEIYVTDRGIPSEPSSGPDDPAQAAWLAAIAVRSPNQPPEG